MPDDLPWDEVLAVAEQVPRHAALGPGRLGPGDAAAATCSAAFGDERDGLDPDDPWQFTNFLVR